MRSACLLSQEWLVNSPEFSEKYAHAFLWGAGMVTAMVPYDIMPVTVMESWITVAAMYIGLVLNAIVISSLTTALSSMNAKKQLTSKKLDTIRTYMVLKAVPNDLRSRVLEYYEYLFTSSQSLAKSVQYDEMPPNLATQVCPPRHASSFRPRFLVGRQRCHRLLADDFLTPLNVLAPHFSRSLLSPSIESSQRNVASSGMCRTRAWLASSMRCRRRSSYPPSPSRLRARP